MISVPMLDHKPTMQEVFNNTWEFFVVQKHERSTRPNTTRMKDTIWICSYRSEDSACAIGCNLPDELYNQFIEWHTIITIFNTRYPNKNSDHMSLIKNYFSNCSILFLSSLQICHDCADIGNFHIDIEYRLGRLSEEWSLSIP